MTLNAPVVPVEKEHTVACRAASSLLAERSNMFN